jgi:hypothetical protein
MTSQLNVDTIAAKNGTSPVSFTKQQAAKLVANCTLGGALNDASSLNVSSLADGGAGLNTLTATNAFSATKAAVPNMTNHDSSYARSTAVDDTSTSAFVTRIFQSDNGSLTDSDTDHAVVIHGDLA